MKEKAKLAVGNLNRVDTSGPEFIVDHLQSGQPLDQSFFNNFNAILLGGYRRRYLSEAIWMLMYHTPKTHRVRELTK